MINRKANSEKLFRYKQTGLTRIEWKTKLWQCDPVFFFKKKIIDRSKKKSEKTAFLYFSNIRWIYGASLPARVYKLLKLVKFNRSADRALPRDTFSRKCWNSPALFQTILARHSTEWILMVRIAGYQLRQIDEYPSSKHSAKEELKTREKFFLCPFAKIGLFARH